MKTTINTIFWSHGLTSDLHLFGKELEPAMVVYGNVCHHFLLSPSLLSWSNHGNHDLHPYLASPHQPYTPTPPPFVFSSPFSFPMPLNGIDLEQGSLDLHLCTSSLVLHLPLDSWSRMMLIPRAPMLPFIKTKHANLVVTMSWPKRHRAPQAPRLRHEDFLSPHYATGMVPKQSLPSYWLRRARHLDDHPV
jgi:hypothetical protein